MIETLRKNESTLNLNLNLRKIGDPEIEILTKHVSEKTKKKLVDAFILDMKLSDENNVNGEAVFKSPQVLYTLNTVSRYNILTGYMDKLKELNVEI